MSSRPTSDTVVEEHGDTMSLLRRIVDDAVDPGYAQATTSVRRRGSPRSRRGTLALTLLLLGALLTATVIQVRLGASGVERARTELLKRVEAATAATDRLAEGLDETRQSVQQLRASALDATDDVLGGCWATDHRSLLLKKEDGSDWW